MCALRMVCARTRFQYLTTRDRSATASSALRACMRVASVPSNAIENAIVGNDRPDAAAAAKAAVNGHFLPRQAPRQRPRLGAPGAPHAHRRRSAAGLRMEAGRGQVSLEKSNQ